MAAAIHPTTLPPLSTDRPMSATVPLGKVSTERNPAPMELSKPTSPAKSTPSDEIDIMDLIFRAQPGLSPEHSKLEISDTKSTSLRSKLDLVVRKIIK